MESFLTPKIVGRSQELGRLENILSEVRAGVGRCVLVSGEAGIGKTRLLAETRRRAAEEGFNVLIGRCFEQDMVFPYAPLIDLLRTHFARRKTAEIVELLRPQGPVLSKLLPELSPRVSAQEPPAALEPETEKRRLFEALAEYILGQSETRPLVLIVEDLHWSDAVSLEFLLFLARLIAPYPVLLLLSFRPDETHTGLTMLLSGMDREPTAQALKLKPLTRSEVEEMMRSILDQHQVLSAEFLEAIYSLTDGNPFFTEEIFTSLIAAGDIYMTKGGWRRKRLSQIQIPDNVQRLVERRLSKLSQPAGRLLDLAAVSGRSFDFAVLQSLTGHSDSELLKLIKELISAQLVVEENADQFTFRHALTREALYARLLAREQQSLHGRMAQAVEQIHAGALDAHLEALAYHSFEAGVWDKALEYAWQAGEKALALYAPHAAAEQFSRALTAADHLSSPPLLTRLYRLRGGTFDTLGDFDRARTDYEAALQAARAAGDQREVWEALLDLGLLWASRDYSRTGDYCRQALELARSMEDQAATGHSLNRLGNWLMNSGKPEEALVYHREALAIFETLADRPGIAATLDLLAMTSNQSGDWAAMMSCYERAVPILRDLNDRQTLCSSLSNMVLYTLDLEQAHEAVALAREIGWRSGEAYALGSLGFALFHRGRYGEALAAQKQGLDVAEAIEHPQWTAFGHIFLGQMYAELLALSDAQKHLEQGLTLARQIGSDWFTWVGAGSLASVHISQGDFSTAESLLADVPAAWQPSLFMVKRAQIELALAQQDADRMLQLLADIPAVRVPESAVGAVMFLQGPLLILKGQALVLQQRWKAADEALRQALCLYTGTGTGQIRLWRIYLALGEAYQAASQPEQAEEAFDAACDQVELLAAAIDDKALSENFHRRAAAVIPQAQPQTPLQAVKQEFGGLTRRERQVASVVARGLSNQEIAAELVVSIKTVEAHVSRILSKLGFSSRAQIAAWAVDKGLASAPRDLDSLSADR